jgi:hypothetical protein
MGTVPLRPAEEQDTLGRCIRHVARYYNGGTQLGTTEAFDPLLVRLTEAERKLAKIAHALNGDERRAA